ncbi:MAG: hypothetical protein P8O79_01920 [Halieaceae bacterium]|nr:hypothetical protein [Halieaceae bacterium]
MSYYNDGDWVENCTALVQDFDGKFHLLHPTLTLNPTFESLAAELKSPLKSESIA